jgi:hypothetical protein
VVCRHVSLTNKGVPRVKNVAKHWYTLQNKHGLWKFSITRQFNSDKYFTYIGLLNLQLLCISQEVNNTESLK